MTLKKIPHAPFKRVIWIVLDGVGAGELPKRGSSEEDCDPRSNTLGNLSHFFFKKTGHSLKIPHLTELGIGNITPMKGIPPLIKESQTKTAFGKAAACSPGKDTTSGHWEMAGIILKKPFPIYPDGFPASIIHQWATENHLPGVLGNKIASGTEILQELGEEHIQTGKPILYTSTDSVWQIAAHETEFGLERLYFICQSARKICDKLQVSRVIARPFIGEKANNFKRTYHRKDFSLPPPGKTYLDLLCSFNIPTLGIGKISDIFAKKGIQQNINTHGNTDGIKILLKQIDTFKEGLLFCNLIDFDMLYGHRRDPHGFALALEEFDQCIPEIKKRMLPSDLLVITADHGNDPTYPGTNHTREYIPIIIWSCSSKFKTCMNLETLSSFADIGATITHAILGTKEPLYGFPGTSFLEKLGFL